MAAGDWLLVVVASACGKKGDPRAPELATPKLITNLAARPAADGVVLTWNRPTEYVDGSELKDLASFVIFRKEISQELPGLPGAVPATDDGVRRGPGEIRATKTVSFRRPEVRANTIYRYRVSSQLFDGSLSGPSNEVEITR